jgi:hypothetical protein
MDIVSYHTLGACFSEFVVWNNIHIILLTDIFNDIWRMQHYVQVCDLQKSDVSLCFTLIRS